MHPVHARHNANTIFENFIQSQKEEFTLKQALVYGALAGVSAYSLTAITSDESQEIWLGEYETKMTPERQRQAFVRAGLATTIVVLYSIVRNQANTFMGTLIPAPPEAKF